MKVVNVGLVGLGTVGTGVVRILRAQGGEIGKKTGIRMVLKRVGVKSLSKKRQLAIPKTLLTQNPNDLAKDPTIDILVELIGGIHPAREIIAKAFASGKHVVTANKALLAEEGAFVFREAVRHSRRLGFEASVCGGIPIIKSLQEGLVSNSITHFLGIVNGTCNFILTRMSEEKMSFRAALKEAQSKGYAEKDPRLDVEGIDSAHKLAILARLAFRAEVPFKKISVEGIQSLEAADIEYARELGYRVKLLAIGKKLKEGLELRVHPTMLPLEHPLSNVGGVYNAVFVHGDQTGDLLFYGQGAGMMPTASAVVSDILDIGKQLFNPLHPATLDTSAAYKILPIQRIVSKYYLRFQVEDRPGVLGRIARTLGRHDISILSVHQKESHDPSSVPVIILTYEACEENLRSALKEIDAEKAVSQRTRVLRVEH